MSRAEKFIQDYTRNCSNAFADVNYAKDVKPKGVLKKVYLPWLTPDQARKAVEIAREEMIENACKWLKDYKSPLEELGLHIFIDDGFINDFKQAMKDE